MTGDEAVQLVDARCRPRLTEFSARPELRETEGAVRIGELRSSPDAASASYGLWLQCHWPEASPAEDDVVYLMISLSHLDTVPRLMADVSWASGHIAAQLRDVWGSDSDWPVVSTELLDELDDALPHLFGAFAAAAVRGPRRLTD